MGAKTLLTVEQFERLPQPEDHRAELDEGELIEVTFPTPKHNRVLRIIGRLLEDFALKSGAGEVFPSDTGYVLGDGTLRGPDVSFITAERARALDPNRNIPGAPDLAIEVVSPTDTISAMRRKVRQYLEAGARVVWVIDPDAREAQVYTNATAPPVILAAQDHLKCPELLPGFQIAVSALFD